jgi:hypothetical protein
MQPTNTNAEHAEGETFIFTDPEIREVKNVDQVNRRYDNGIRIYRNSPSSVTIQIRAYGPTNERGNGTPKLMIATASYIGVDQIKMIIERLQQALNEIA